MAANGVNIRVRAGTTGSHLLARAGDHHVPVDKVITHISNHFAVNADSRLLVDASAGNLNRGGNAAGGTPL